MNQPTRSLAAVAGYSPLYGPIRLGLVIGIAVLLVFVSAGAAWGDRATTVDFRNGLPASRAGLSLVDFELPLDFVARLGGFYSRKRYAIDALAHDRWFSPGPGVRRDSLLESRVSIGRRIARGFEFELAWQTQSEFSFSSIPKTDRQIVGAYFRFSH